MSQEDINRNIHLELSRLNRLIDLKIIKGLSYREEARRHKFLATLGRRVYGAV
jgi:hypothetical protein